MPMNRKVIIGFILLVVLGIIGSAGVIIYKKFAPSSIQRPMSEQYKLGQEEVLVILNGRPLEEKGRLIQDVVYVPVSLASDSMNERIYWDEKENILSLATSGGLVTVNTEDSMRYMLGKESTASEYQLLYEDRKSTRLNSSHS